MPDYFSTLLVERVRVSGFLFYSYLMVFSTLLLPLVAFSVFLVSWQVSIIANIAAPAIEKIASALGILVVLQSYLYLLLFNIPLPMKKNVFGIRWGVLSRLYPFGMHPQIKKWIDEADKDSKQA